MDNDESLDNKTSLDNDESLDEDTMMNKNDLINAMGRMIQRTRQELVHDPVVAQEYYEKVQHLSSIMRTVTNFERQLLIDLDVD
jgi:hypothetical protein